MAASAFPLAAGNPFLMEEKPFDGPRNDAVNDVFIRQPGIVYRVVNAQARKRGGMPEPVDVLGRVAGPARVGTDGWVENEDTHIRIGEIPSLVKFPPEVDDADTVGLADRPHRALPDAEPARMRR